jgi:hypothetical protein
MQLARLTVDQIGDMERRLAITLLAFHEKLSALSDQLSA